MCGVTSPQAPGPWWEGAAVPLPEASSPLQSRRVQGALTQRGCGQVFPGQEVGRGSGPSLPPGGSGGGGRWTVPGERQRSAGDPGPEPLTARLTGFSGQAAHRQARLPGGEQLRSQCVFSLDGLPRGASVFAKRNRGVQPKPAASGDRRPVTLDVGEPGGGGSRKPAAPERGWGPAGGVVDLTHLSPPDPTSHQGQEAPRSACAHSLLHPVPFPKMADGGTVFT
ncbi:unnamed protein product [Rangifer tarandus platyrhynchus]|uniref:Uncharacterized protein n=2 Tax=Rangifer tarandus platyrhynchus TaxID=3082113 RepID=A0ABN8ZYA5_RANTA|nr:unnamed protein product [Rangifer tarandus platyrhynchus]CAI9712104.1 unnamed protein product [Rangifer tarandus platyrhynchus]